MDADFLAAADRLWWDGREMRMLHICQAPVEYLYVDNSGLLALTSRGVERVPVPEEIDD